MDNLRRSESMRKAEDSAAWKKFAPKKHEGDGAPPAQITINFCVSLIIVALFMFAFGFYAFNEERLTSCFWGPAPQCTPVTCPNDSNWGGAAWPDTQGDPSRAAEFCNQEWTAVDLTGQIADATYTCEGTTWWSNEDATAPAYCSVQWTAGATATDPSTCDGTGCLASPCVNAGAGNICNAEPTAQATEDYVQQWRTWFLLGFILYAVGAGIKVLQYVAQFLGEAGGLILFISIIPVILQAICTQVWVIWGAVVRWGGDGAGPATADMPGNERPAWFMMIYLILGFIGVAACACVCCCIACAVCGVGAAAAAGKAQD